MEKGSKNVRETGGIYYDLTILNLLILALIAVIILVPFNTILRITLAVPFLLGFPGYALTAALLPVRNGISMTERLAFSVALSIPVIALLGIVLDFTVLGIRFEPLLAAVASFTSICSVIAWFRRHKAAPPSQITSRTCPLVIAWFNRTSGRVLFTLLVSSVLFSVGLLGFVVASSPAIEKYTEFYIVANTGMISGYPQELAMNDRGKVKISIVNRENGTVSYRVAISVDGQVETEVGPVTLVANEKWEQEASFKPTAAGKKQKVEFLLYRDGNPEVYRSLYLWIDVK